MAWLTGVDRLRGDNLLESPEVSVLLDSSRDQTNFAVIPGYIEYPSWMGTRKGFTPLSSPPTSRRAKTIPFDGIPHGIEGGINLYQSVSRTSGCRAR